MDAAYQQAVPESCRVAALSQVGSQRNFTYRQTAPFVCYLITCDVNGKRYVGKTKSLRLRWRAHKECWGWLILD